MLVAFTYLGCLNEASFLINSSRNSQIQGQTAGTNLIALVISADNMLFGRLHYYRPCTRLEALQIMLPGLKIPALFRITRYAAQSPAQEWATANSPSL